MLQEDTRRLVACRIVRSLSSFSCPLTVLCYGRTEDDPRLTARVTI